MKKLHKLMMLSNAYQQSSAPTARPVTRNSKLETRNSLDPENALLWRMNRRRLDFEAMRDAILAASGQLDRAMGGPSVNILAAPFSKRRSVYAFIDRQNLPGVFRVFDFANPDLHSPQRLHTTVPQQALFLMNSPFIAEQAAHLAARAEAAAKDDPVRRVEALYRFVYGRNPTARQKELALQFIQSEAAACGAAGDGTKASPWQRYAQALLLSNELMFVD